MPVFLLWFCCWGAGDLGPAFWCGQAEGPYQAETFALWAWAGHVDQEHAECSQALPVQISPSIYLCAITDGAITALCVAFENDHLDAEISCRSQGWVAGLDVTSVNCGSGWASGVPPGAP